MNAFLTTIKFDYLQRTRSYAFLITLCISLAVAYSFVPEPNASYSTIRIGDYLGAYNSAWFGYVTAIMTSVFLSLIGFYLINNSIANDQKTKMGQIVAATAISNFKYLVSKVLSNFLVLLTIVVLVFVMSIVLFFSYNAGYPFELLQFLKPYILITFPAIFIISVFAIAFEVLFGRFSTLQNMAFFFLFSALMVFRPNTESQFAFDVFGNKIVMHHMEETVKGIDGVDDTFRMTIGYILGHVKDSKTFDFQGLDFPTSYIISRVLWIFLGFGLIGIMAPFFHRFNVKERKIKTKKSSYFQTLSNEISEIDISTLTQPKTNFGLFSILKIELLLLFRSGKRWLWIFNFIGMVLLALLPLHIAHQFVLPILWFLQVHRISDLTSKELSNSVHYFAFTSFKPLGRLLLSQLLSATLLMFILALPLIARLGIHDQAVGAFSVAIGSIFIVMFAAVLGLLTKGKKLFEVLFFMLTYANINGIPFLDYFGAFQTSTTATFMFFLIIICLIGLIFWLRRLQIRSM